MDRKEHDLIKDIQKGNTDIYGEIVKMYKHKIFGHLYTILGNEDDAKDLTQDIFIKAYHKIHQFQFKSSFQTWLYRLSTNHTIDYMRKKNRTVKTCFLDESRNDELLKEDLTVQNRERKNILYEAMNDLDQSSQMILQMKELQGLSYKDIASALKIKIGTVMSRLFNSRKKLKEILIKKGL